MKEQPMALRYITREALHLFKRDFLITPEEEALLTETLTNNGFIVPIFVRPILQSKYEVLDGKKRVVIAEKCGIDRIPCIVYDYMGDSVAKEYEAWFRTVASGSKSEVYVNALKEILISLKDLIDSFERNLGTAITKLSSTRQEQELFQHSCTAYNLEAVECLASLRQKLANDPSASEVVTLLRRIQEYMLNIQHRVGIANVELMQMEEKILDFYNLISRTLELSNNVSVYLKDS
mgnify:CR=1 FL=1